MEKENYRPKEAAAYLGVGISTIWRYIKNGKLTAHKISDRVTIIHRFELEKLAHINH